MIYPKVVIIGGGFAGLNAAKALKNAPVEVFVLDRVNHHVFQPLLYQVATAALSADTIASPIRKILAKNRNTTVLLADVVLIDKEKKEVIAACGKRFSYDFLIVAPGASHSYFGNDSWAQHAPGLKTITDALYIRNHLLLAYEKAEKADSMKEAARLLRFIIIGAGPTGVEMAGAIAEISKHALIDNFRKIRPEQTKIYLIEGAGQVLPSYPQDLAQRAKEDLEKLGVIVRLNTSVTKVVADGVWIGDEFLESPNIIWAAGNQGSSLLTTLNSPLDRSGRAVVEKDLSIAQHPEVFVIGDAACFLDKQGRPLPGIAPVAIQQGRYVAKLIAKSIKPENRSPFRYFDKGMMATIGKAKAVAKIGKIKITGYFAWLSWCFIHVLYLVSFTNRLQVLFQWFYLYIFNKRSIRLIMHPYSKASSSDL